MQEGVSQKLKGAMEEIKEILDKHQIAGTIFLADGDKCGEFLIGIDRPDWSNIRFIERADGSTAIHTKVHMKSAPKETNMTINALYNLQGMMGNVFMMQKAICDDWESKIEIEKEAGKIIPHQRPQS